MQSHQKSVASIVEQQHEQQLGPIIPCKIFNNNKSNDKSPILSSEFEFLNPLIKSGSNKLTSNRKHSNNNNTKNNKLKRTVSDFGKISVENVRANDHQKKSSNVAKLFKSDYSLSKVAQIQQQQHHRSVNNDDDHAADDDEISPLLLDTTTNNLTIKVITDDKNVLLFTKKSVIPNVGSCSNGSSEQSNAVTINDKDKENLVKYQKRQNLKLPLNGGYYYNNKSDKSEVKESSETTGSGTSGTEKQKNNWRHSWYAPVYGVLEEETETIKVRRQQPLIFLRRYFQTK